MIIGYTKLYSHREKTDISSEISNEKIRFSAQQSFYS